jgi:hypothetical protein
MTEDVDVVLGRLSAIDGHMRDVLRAAGFREEMAGDVSERSNAATPERLKSGHCG